MPTQPIKEILDRNHDEIKDTLERICALLREVINYGTVVLDASVKMVANPKIEQNEHPVVLSGIFAHLLEMLDAVEILVKERAGIPSVIQTRSIFESMLYLEWILRDPSEMQEKALMYLLDDIYDRIRIRRSLDPATNEGQEILKKHSRDKIAKDMPALNMPDSDIANKKWDSMFSRDPLKGVHNNYSAYIKHNKKAKWYSYHGGGISIEQLANKLDFPFAYWLLYRQWSAVVHGQHRLREKVVTGGGFKPLRVPESIPNNCNLAISFALFAIIAICKYYKPKGVDFKKWYKEEVQREYKWLNQLNINVNYI